ncbi:MULTISPECIES: hypothetical protein [Nocardia]|uniref:CopG family transcriptional regulator n=1 Tax=Nocardia sputorum TaxID=2984338 RepID=A0ABN6UAC8_9NOCA|nr:hypothetical protein [Nocardia sputorum]BDT94531.1 hypothetical protein IFM12275_45070 [Nocardia sputorum]BDU02223.1 hypothetical protein IFM12276_52510 [Nocardia sputorum]
MNVTPAEEEFIRARSKAMSDAFMDFVTSRALDMDMDTWPDADRREFDIRNRALIEEWKRKARELP